MVNPYVLVAALAFVVITAAGAAFKGYLYGRESREDEVITLRASISAAEAVARDFEARGKAAAARAKAEYEAKVQKIRLEAENRPQLIRVIRDESTCDLPAAFRVLHDAAAGYSAAEGSGKPVGAADAAETIATNYQICRENAERHQALISIIRESVGNNNQQN